MTLTSERSPRRHLRRSLRLDGLTVEYDDRVLEPRPWAAMQAQWAVELVDGAPEGRLLELCCGAGHIGLLATVASGRRLVAVDVDPAAAYFTRLNAEGAGVSHRVEVREGRLEESLVAGETFVLAIADPPWVTSERVVDFPEDPQRAVDGGPDGLALARACVATVRDHLPVAGSLLLQLGDDGQADSVLAETVGPSWRDGGRRAGERGVVLRLVRAQS